MENSRFKLFQQCCFSFSLLMVLATTGCATVDLSSPVATIMGYCNGAGENVTQYFNRPVDPKIFGEGFDNCRIIYVKETDDVGTEYGAGFIVREGDMDVETEVDVISPVSGLIKVRFWYSLRNYQGKWKIVQHYGITDNPEGISDENEPCGCVADN